MNGPAGPAGPIVNIPKRSCRHGRERVHRASTSRWPNGAPLKVTKGTFKVAQYGAVLRRLFQMAQTRVGAGHGRRRRGSRPRSRALRRCQWARGHGVAPVRSPGLPRRDRPRRWGGHETTEPGLRQSGDGEGLDDALRADQGFDLGRGEFQDGINSFDGIRAGSPTTRATYRATRRGILRCRPRRFRPTQPCRGTAGPLTPPHGLAEGWAACGREEGGQPGGLFREGRRDAVAAEGGVALAGEQDQA